ncbi:uncharacterized protein ACNLHF_019309 [Anomaloglossus baeobatrachus]
MDNDRDKMAERILHLTLEILFRLTGKDYTVVEKTSSECSKAPVSEGWGRPLSPITGPPPHPLIHEDINDQKILELTYKMIELLTGEVIVSEAWRNMLCPQILKQKMMISHHLENMPFSQIYLQPFSAKILHLNLFIRSYLLICLLSKIKINGRLKIKELAEGRSNIHA